MFRIGEAIVVASLCRRACNMLTWYCVAEARGRTCSYCVATAVRDDVSI